MNDSLFDKDQDQMNFNQDLDFLAELAGEGKKFDKSKYQSQEEWEKAIARGKYEADHFINVKNRQYDDLRQDYLRLKDDYEQRAKLEEILTEIQKQQNAGHEDTHNVNDEQGPKYDPDQVKSIAALEYKALREQEKQEANFVKVQDKLRERYGDNYKASLNKQAMELGLSEDFVNNLARQNPTVFFKTFDLDTTPQSESFQSPLASSRRSDSFAPNVPKRTWSYYQRMRKENPALYSDPKTAVQMEKDYIELGPAFEDGDFHSR